MFKLSPESRNSFSLLALLVCLFSLFAHAEEIGVYGTLHGGINLARFSSSGAQENRRGLTVGGGIEIPLGDLFFLQPEVTYIEKGSRTTLGAINAAGLADSFIKYDFVDVPILLKKRFGRGEFTVDLVFGPYIGFAMTRAAITQDASGTVTTTNLDSSLQSLDYGAVFGIGGNFKIDAETGVFLHGRYLWGLANLSVTASSVSVKTSAISLILGYKVLL